MSRIFDALVVGAGSIGERHARCFTATGRARVAVCEPNEPVRTAVAERYRLSGAFADLDEALRHRFDVAVVATPANLHIAQAADLARRGVHVLVEKPLSTRLDGVGPLQSLLNERQLVGAVAYSYRANPVLAAMRDVARRIDFGRPLQVIVQAGQSFATYRPAYRSTYYRSRDTGGGALQDALTHLINAVEWLVGPATRVTADAERLALDGVDVEDTIHLLARHGDVLAAYTLNQHQPANETTITLVAARGQLRAEFHRRRVSWMTEVDGPWHEEVLDAFDQDLVFRRQAEAFLDAVEGKSAPLCSLGEGRSTLDAVLAALRSLDSRAWESC